MAGRVGAGEAHARHVAAFDKALADVHGVETLGGAAGGVGEGQLLAVHLPREAVGHGGVLRQLQLAAHRGFRLNVGVAGVEVDARGDILHAEGKGVVLGAAETEIAALGIHLACLEGEVLRGKGAFEHIGTAGTAGALGHELDAAS